MLYPPPGGFNNHNPLSLGLRRKLGPHRNAGGHIDAVLVDCFVAALGFLAMKGAAFNQKSSVPLRESQALVPSGHKVVIPTPDRRGRIRASGTRAPACAAPCRTAWVGSWRAHAARAARSSWRSKCDLCAHHIAKNVHFLLRFLKAQRKRVTHGEHALHLPVSQHRHVTNMVCPHQLLRAPYAVIGSAADNSGCHHIASPYELQLAPIGSGEGAHK